MKPPLLPPAYKQLSVVVRLLASSMITYADDGNVLDVVVGRHVVWRIEYGAKVLLEAELVSLIV
jgi:hypothetical protein